jgi:hypothetical protein
VNRQATERMWAALPAAVLVIVACTQIWASRAHGLSPWKGGGFGMFASLDSRPFRYARIFVHAADRDEELTVTPSLERAAAAAELLPTARQLDQLARAVVARERRHGRPVERVRVEVWHARFSPGSLSPETRRLREQEHRVDW